MAYSKSNVSDPGRGKSLSGFEYIHQHSSVAGDVPASAELKTGELAINTADQKLYIKAFNGAVVPVPPNGLNQQISITDSQNTVHSFQFENGILTTYDTV